MFVKLQVLKRDENGDYPVGQVHVWECEYYNVLSSEIDDVPHFMLNVFDGDLKLLRGNEWQPKWEASVYIMNNEGKTVDSFEWNGLLAEEMQKDKKK